MNEPQVTSERVLAHQPAGAGPAATAPSGSRAERIKVVLVSESDARPIDPIESLLRRRLGVITLILWAVHTCALMLFLGNLIRDKDKYWPAITFNAALWLVEAVYVALLWGERPLSLRALRTLEVILFGMLMAGYAGYICSDYRLGALLEYANLQYPKTEKYQGKDIQGGISALAAAVALPGFALLVIYGTFIPNTGRRCAIIVAGMSLFPLLVTAVSGLRESDLDGDLLGRFVIQVALFLAFGAAIAIYGSHRIDTLRREALAARRLGQYQLTRLLGAGGMGNVYLAEHLLLRRPCALKVIRPELTHDPQSSLRFEREVRSMAALTHPNTVEIFDYGHAADGTFYYVMEYLPGLTLEELVERYGPLPPERAVHLLRQVCAALEEAHGVGLIHRDIKPSNILTCERGRVFDVAKLLDFGMALPLGGPPAQQPERPLRGPHQDIRAAEPPEGGEGIREEFWPELGPFVPTLTGEKGPSGTPLFMSPEQACGRDDVDPRSDIYSLGATAYFLLTGQPPFPGTSTAQVLDAHLNQPVRPLTELRGDVPEDVQEVVLRCLEKAPAKRYPDVASLEQALARCACADGWTREKAALWWRQYTEAQASTT